MNAKLATDQTRYKLELYRTVWWPLQLRPNEYILIAILLLQMTESARMRNALLSK